MFVRTNAIVAAMAALPRAAAGEGPIWAEMVMIVFCSLL